MIVTCRWRPLLRRLTNRCTYVGIETYVVGGRLRGIYTKGRTIVCRGSSVDISKDISIPQAELIVRNGYHKDMTAIRLVEADHKKPTGLWVTSNHRVIDKAFELALRPHFGLRLERQSNHCNGRIWTSVVEDALPGVSILMIPSRCLEGT